MFSTAFAFPAVLFGSLLFFSCSGMGSNSYVSVLSGLEHTSQAADQDLAVIDSVEVASLLKISDEVKTAFEQNVTDTLDLAFAKELDAFLTANKELQQLNDDRKRCEQANSAAQQRIASLQKDIAAGAGDRTEYGTNVKREQAEMRQIRNHSLLLRRTFESAKAAITHYQPEVERYINRFTQSVTVP